MKTVIAYNRDESKERQRGQIVPISINFKRSFIKLGEPCEVDEEVYAFLTEPLNVLKRTVIEGNKFDLHTIPQPRYDVTVVQ